jgi:hypothetical protein
MKQKIFKWKKLDTRGKKIKEMVVIGDQLVVLTADGMIFYKLIDKKDL